MIADLIITLAEILLITSYFFTNILILRVIAALGMMTYMVGGFVAGYQEEGMKAVIFFSGMAALVNFIQIALIIKERFDIFLPMPLRKIHKKCFEALNANEFLKIYNLAKTTTFKEGEIIIQDETRISSIFLLIDGEVTVSKNGEFLVNANFGDFLGEMSYISKKNTYANIIANSPTTCLEWKYDSLEALQMKNPNLYNKFFSSMALNIVSKLEKTSETKGKIGKPLFRDVAKKSGDVCYKEES